MAFCPSVNFGSLGFGPAANGKRQKQVLPEKKSLTIPQKAIPIDLLFSIFSRLPAKSIARFRCVSKQWASIFRGRDFTQLYMKMSLARPCLLFTVELNGMLIFFSAPQNLNPDSNSIVPDCHMGFSTEDSAYGISHPIHGLLCSKDKNPMICNPSTGQSITLPKFTPKLRSRVTTYLGYEPIDNLFKVLRVSEDYRVLTLGNGELSWRMVRCAIPHWPIPDGICINGVLYYLASSMGIGSRNLLMLVRFDFRLEEFSFFFDVEDLKWESTLINFKGRLGAVLPDDSDGFFTGTSTRLEVLVLDDIEDEKWSKHIYELPPLWKNLAADSLLYIVGMTGTDEIVFSQCFPEVPFYIFCYNVVRNTVVRLEIQLGVVASEDLKIYTFIDHVEDVKLN